MAETGIYIDGRWETGVSSIENRNPSDVSDLIGHYGQAGADQLDAALPPRAGRSPSGGPPEFRNGMTC